MKKNVSRTISLLLATCLMLPIASCTNDGGGTEVSSALESSEHIAGNPDGDKIYYSTRMIQLPFSAWSVHTMGMGDKVCFIASRGYHNEETGSSTYEYSLYIYDYEGNKVSECELRDSSDYIIEDCCLIDGDRIVTVGGSSDYRIYDLEGNVVKTADTGKTIPMTSDCVCRTDDGFMIKVGASIARYDNDGERIDEIVMQLAGNGYPEKSLNGVFEQDGKYYAYGDQFTGEYSSVDMYYLADFESGTLEPLFSPEGIMPDAELNGPDYMRNTCGEDNWGRDVVEVDMAQQKTVKLADKDDMLICPPTYSNDRENRIRVLDKMHFCIVYDYRTINIPVTEIALISPDEDLRLDQRTPVVIQGAGLSGASVLAEAAYYYNASQNEYLITFDDIAEHYGMTSPEDIQTTKLQLLARYNSGETPDIFFGDFFDYEYMGDNGMVIDLKPYLGDSPVYDGMVRDDGRMYQVWAGYIAKGFFGLDTVYDSDVDITAMPGIPDGQERFGSAFSTDVAYYALGSDLSSLYHNGLFTRENVLSVVRTAIAEAHTPDYQYSDYTPTMPEDIRLGRTSLYNGAVASPQSYYNMMQEFGGKPVFVGYPSIGGSVHMMYPECMMAVSSSTEHIDVCVGFISTIMSVEVQRKICASGFIPANRDVLMEMIEVLRDPQSASEEQKLMYGRQIIVDYTIPGDDQSIPMTDEMVQDYLKIADLANTVEVFDWGLWTITRDEMNTYYAQGKSIEDVADALYSRFLVYAQENF